MPNEVKIIFNKRFPNLLNKITPYIEAIAKLLLLSNSSLNL